MSFFSANAVTFYNGQILYAPVPSRGTHPYVDLNGVYCTSWAPEDPVHKLATALQLLHTQDVSHHRAGVSILRALSHQHRTNREAEAPAGSRRFLEGAQIHTLALTFLGICYQDGVGVQRRCACKCPVCVAACATHQCWCAQIQPVPVPCSL